MEKCKVIWLYGLSGAGKTTLGLQLQAALERKQQKTVLLDGDSLRQGMNKDLGFTDDDRSENIRRVSEMAKLLHANSIVCICCLITPLEAHRKLSKHILGKDMIQIYVDCPIEECEKRDVKGLYKKARKQQISQFTGITATFETPLTLMPDFTVRTFQYTVQECVMQIMEYICLRAADKSGI